jgi:hypothetical protein
MTVNDPMAAAVTSDGKRSPKSEGESNLESPNTGRSDRKQAKSEQRKTGRAHDQTSARGPHFPATVIGRIGDEGEPNYRFRIPKIFDDPMAAAVTSDE